MSEGKWVESEIDAELDNRRAVLRIQTKDGLLCLEVKMSEVDRLLDILRRIRDEHNSSNGT